MGLWTQQSHQSTAPDRSSWADGTQGKLPIGREQMCGFCFLHEKHHWKEASTQFVHGDVESNKASLAWEIRSTRIDQVWQGEECSAPSINFTGISCSYIFFVWSWYRNLAICSRRGTVELNNYPNFHQQKSS